MPDIPTELDLSTFIRIFIPGIVFSVIFSYAIFPIFLYSNWIELKIEDKIILWIFAGIISGTVINCFESYIYKFFEGLKFWPDNIRQKKLNRIQKSYKKNLDEFPFNPEKGERYPMSPTRLGNVMAEYETYSFNQYGIDMEIFWPHLRILVPKEIKEDIDVRGAKADLLVYISFIFLMNTTIGGLGFSYQLIETTQKLQTLHEKIGMFIVSFAIISFIFLILSYIFYLASIPVLKIYGRYVKALFDLYRFDLAEKFQCDTDIVVMKSEIDWWKKFGAYLKNQVPPKE